MTGGDATPGLRVEARGPVLLVTIDRPHVRNAVDIDTAWAIAAAMDRLDDDAALLVGVLTGSGGVFSAGADLKAPASARPLPERGNFGLCFRPAAKPVIAAIEGFALGGGFEMALACDLIVAAKGAALGLPEIRHNLVAAAGGAFRLAQRIPYHLAMEIALTGTPRNADEFAAWHLVNRLTEPGQACAGALALAEELTGNGPTALAATIAIMRGARGLADTDAWAMQQPIITALRATADYAEGRRAFVEKRPPQWTGR